MSRKLFRFCIFLLLVPFASAQQPSASLGAWIGVLRSQDGHPVNGATIIVRSTSPEITRSATTQKGNFEFKNLPTGAYWVSIKWKEKIYKSEIQIAAGETLSGDLSLTENTVRVLV